MIARQVNISEIYGICLAENKASLAVMRKCGFENVLSAPETYAVCLKENNKAIGSIGLMIGTVPDAETVEEISADVRGEIN